jgi:tungstate transport system ATP-binding protein
MMTMTMMMRPPILPLQLTNVGVSAHNGGKQIAILSNISLLIEAGTRTIILGPNGAGKSFLLRLMHGLVIADAGRVQWNKLDRVAQAMVFQKPVMLRRTVLENIEYALRIAGADNAARKASEALERAGLTALAQRQARQCSGGEQQRVALARAWALNPEVLFLDEPTASLDPSATKHVEAMIQAMHANGMTIVMTSHDLGQAKRLSDAVVFLHEGQLLEHTLASSFFAKPKTELAQAFLRGDLLC